MASDVGLNVLPAAITWTLVAIGGGIAVSLVSLAAMGARSGGAFGRLPSVEASGGAPLLACDEPKSARVSLAVRICLFVSVVGLCMCTLGSVNAFGGSIAACPVHSAEWISKEIPYGGEAVFRMQLGSSLMLVALMVIACMGALMLCMDVTTKGGNHGSMTDEGNAIPERRLFKLVTLLGGFVMFGAAQLDVILVSVWMNVFGRLLLSLLFLRDAASIRSKDIAAFASRNKLPTACLTLFAFGVNVGAPFCILLAPFLSSWTCDVAIDDVRLAVCFGMLGAEMLIIYTIVATFLEIKDSLARREAMPFASYGYLVAQNVSIIGVLIFMSGHDLWAL